MLSSAVLDVGIGLALVYVLLSLLCTGVNEWLAGLFHWRAGTLREGIRKLLADDQLLAAFYEHPLVGALSQPGRGPSYLSSTTFARTLMDLTRDPASSPSAQGLTDGIEKLPGPLKRSLKALLQSPGLTLDDAEREIAQWFDHAMDRVSGWYKRRTQLRTVGLAVAVTFLANADTLQIADRLWSSPVLRAAVVEVAKTRAAQPVLATADYPDPESPIPEPPPVVRNEEADAKERGPFTPQETAVLGELTGWTYEFRVLRALLDGTLPSPWEATPQRVSAYTGSFPGAGLARPGILFSWLLAWILPKHALGWFVTMAAVSLGAPLWFDALKALANLRSSGNPPPRRS